MSVKIKDSGDRHEYETGARRDNREDKGRMDLVPPEAILRLSRWYEAGAKKYSDRNWEKGIPFSRYVDAALRHMFKYLAGCNDEDHLAAVAWNVFSLMHHEVHKKELQDLPGWKGHVSSFSYELDFGTDIPEVDRSAALSVLQFDTSDAAKAKTEELNQ